MIMCGLMMAPILLCKTRNIILCCCYLKYFYFRYGLSPNYGCCSLNFNQGWFKFTQHLVMEHGSRQGLVVAMCPPVLIDHTPANGVHAKLSIKTDYPFNDTVTVDASCEKGMFLSFRIPSLAVQSTVSINGTMQDKTPFPGEYDHCIPIKNVMHNMQVPFTKCGVYSLLRYFNEDHCREAIQ